MIQSQENGDHDRNFDDITYNDDVQDIQAELYLASVRFFLAQAV